MQQFQMVAKRSLAQLKIWSKKEFEGRKKKQNDMEQLEKAWQKPSQVVDGKEIRKLETQVNNMLTEEEMYWKQRSRVDWLREDNQNIKFFSLQSISSEEKKTKFGELKILNGTG